MGVNRFPEPSANQRTESRNQIPESKPQNCGRETTTRDSCSNGWICFAQSWKTCFTELAPSPFTGTSGSFSSSSKPTSPSSRGRSLSQQYTSQSTTGHSACENILNRTDCSSTPPAPAGGGKRVASVLQGSRRTRALGCKNRLVSLSECRVTKHIA